MNRKIGQKILLSGMIVSLLFIAGMTSVQAQPKTIILATTTSTQDSGLFDALIICLRVRASTDGLGPMSVLAWT
jgi:ABC-type tungstate transport system permease subunit